MSLRSLFLAGFGLFGLQHTGWQPLREPLQLSMPLLTSPRKGITIAPEVLALLSKLTEPALFVNGSFSA